MDRKRVGAVAAAIGSLVIGLAVAMPTASAHEGGGTCNNYGDHNIIVAPNCGAPTLPTMTRSTTTTVIPTEDLRCTFQYPPRPGCTGGDPSIPRPVPLPSTPPHF